MINALLVGDVWLAPSLTYKKDDLDLSLKKIAEDNSLDIFICNLEAPFKSEEIRPNRRTLINTEPRLLDTLRIAKKNILTLANNHMSDFGDRALLRTIDGCRERGFLIVGAGVNLEEARKPLILKIKNRKIGVMSYAETASYVGAVAATKKTPGIAPLEEGLILEDINNLKNEADDIWIFLHWGKEFIRYPMEIQRKIARLLVGGGSTMLIGHHPHVIIGVEQIDNVNIYYSLGNFIFPNVELQDKTIFRWDKISRSSIVLKASFKSEFWSIDRKYLYLDKSGLPKLDKDDRALKRFDQLSKIFEYKDYSRIYNYYSKLETIRNISKRTIRINKLFKDILWYLKQKSLK